MQYTYKYINRNEYKTSKWSGGMTTEIGIYPENCKYSEREFLWRISSATVELEESTFTKLSQYNRILAILKGNLTLCHNGGQTIQLNELEQNSFDGEFDTVSKGKVTDYNLMMRKGKATGTVSVIKLNSQSQKVNYVEKTNQQQFDKMTVAYYNIGSNIDIKIGNEEPLQLNSGDSLILNIILNNKENKENKENRDSIKIEFNNCNNENTTLIVSEVFY